MSFSDELARRRPVARPFLSFVPWDNTEIAALIGPNANLYGFVEDNTGANPVIGTLKSLGAFTRSIANDRISIETPRCAVSLSDEAGQWRRWMSRTWVLPRRLMKIGLRLREDSGTYTDAYMLQGLTKDIVFESGGINFTLYDTFGELFNDTVPFNRVDQEAWPFAHQSAVGESYPLVYGKVDNSLDYIRNLTATLGVPAGAAVVGFAAVVAAGGTSLVESYVYAIAPLNAAGNVIGAIRTVNANVTNLTSRVTLTWTYTGPATHFRIWRSGDSSFLQFDQSARKAVVPGTNSLVDTYPGYTLPPSGTAIFTQGYRQQVLYYVTATVAGMELTSGPLFVQLTPMNYQAVRTVTLAWSAVAGATAITVRRALQTYHYAPGVDRTWVLAGNATGYVDTLADVSLPSATGVPPEVVNTRPGALKCLYVDTNPSGAGKFVYVVCQGIPKLIKNVFVTKVPVTEKGTPDGSLERPTGIRVARVGAAGTVDWRYQVTALNANGETATSNIVTIYDGLDRSAMNGANYNDVDWDAVEGATKYRVYVAPAKEDFRYLTEVSGTSAHDTGQTPDSSIPMPETNTTGKSFKTGEAPVRPYPMRQTEGVDFSVASVSYNGVRLTVLLFNEDQGDHDVTCDVWGYETVGNGTGALIEGHFAQFKHFLTNFVFNNWIDGAWFGSSSHVNAASFDQAQTDTAARIPGGYLGAGVLARATTIQQAVYDWLICTDADLYYWQGQLYVKLPVNPDDVDRSALTVVSPQDGILESGFTTTINDSQAYSHIPWRAGEQFDGYRASGVVSNPLARARYGERYASVSTLFWIRDLSTLVDIVSRRAVSWGAPRVLVTFKTPLRLAARALTDMILVTHPDGVTDDADGWVNRLVKIVSSDLSLQEPSVLLTVEDLDGYSLSVLEPAQQDYLLPISLGGSRYSTLISRLVGPGATAQLVPTNYRDVKIDWDEFDTRVEALFTIETLVIHSGGQATPKVFCVETGSVVASGPAIQHDPYWASISQFTPIELVVAASVGVKTYRIIYDPYFGTRTFSSVFSFGCVRIRST